MAHSPEPFDPYHAWLAIPPRDQPPTAYRLLGIDPSESNPDVINNAAERQVAYLRTMQLGQRAAEVQRLINEISAARSLLLDPMRRLAYDASLIPPPSDDAMDGLPIRVDSDPSQPDFTFSPIDAPPRQDVRLTDLVMVALLWVCIAWGTSTVCGAAGGIAALVADSHSRAVRASYASESNAHSSSTNGQLAIRSPRTSLRQQPAPSRRLTRPLPEFPTALFIVLAIIGYGSVLVWLISHLISAVYFLRGLWFDPLTPQTLRVCALAQFLPAVFIVANIVAGTAGVHADTVYLALIAVLWFPCWIAQLEILHSCAQALGRADLISTAFYVRIAWYCIWIAHIVVCMMRGAEGQNMSYPWHIAAGALIFGAQTFVGMATCALALGLRRVSG